MRWKQFLVLSVLLAGLLVLLRPPIAIYADDYSFSLDQEYVEVWINQDGSVSLEYWLTFTCDQGAHAIDVVDLGLPNSYFVLSDIHGDVNGIPIDRVDSDYQGEGTGAAVWLGSGTIYPGHSGTVHVVVNRVERMVYEDSDDPEYASTEFSPVWFGSAYVHGTTEMTVRFHLPPGVQPEEPRWHSSPSGWPYDRPSASLDDQGRVMYAWWNQAAEPDRTYVFGASFPRRVVDASAIQQPPSFIDKFFAAIASFFSLVVSVLCNPGFYVVAFFIVAAIVGKVNQRRRKMQYLPPRLKVEGVGIKRGLTAVEAAILLETPLNKVLTMILFGLLKKGAVTVLDDDPLRAKPNDPLPEDLRPYEKDFIAALTKKGTLSEKRLRSAMVALIKAVNEKMKGFSRKETVAYYKDIVRRAWQQVESSETPEVRSKRFDEALEWTMLDDDFEERTQRTFRTGPVFVPMWWGYYRPWGVATGSTGTAGPRPAAAPGISMPTQLPALPGADFAARIVRGVEGTAGRIVRSVSDFSGGVAQVTNPPPKPSSSGRSYGGGGSSCACACACAGCACACAGGGR